MKYIISIFLIMGTIGFVYGAQEVKITKIFNNIGVLLKESGTALTVDSFEKIAGFINQANVINQSAKRSEYSNIIAGYKEHLYDIYNARQAVDDNNEPMLRVISITYYDPTPIFGGQKEKQVTDQLRNVDPSIEAIEEKRFKEQKVLKDPTPTSEGIRKNLLGIFVEIGKDPLILTVAVLGIAKALGDSVATTESIQKTSILRENISKMLRKQSSKIVTFLKIQVAKLLGQTDKLRAAHSIAEGIGKLHQVGIQARLENIIKITDKIRLTSSGALSVFQELRDMRKIVGVIAEEKLDRLANNIFKTLEKNDQTLLGKIAKKSKDLLEKDPFLSEQLNKLALGIKKATTDSIKELIRLEPQITLTKEQIRKFLSKRIEERSLLAVDEFASFAHQWEEIFKKFR